MIGTHKTKVETKDGITTVTYHNTDVVVFDNHGEITLNTGGWNSVTTRKRMNEASEQFNLGFRVVQKNGDWFIHYKDNVIAYDSTVITLR